MEDHCALDFETATGDRASACQIGIAVFRDGEIIETFESFIQPPGNKYFYKNIQVHGIDPFSTINSPKFDEIWPKISHFIVNQIIVSHNAPFDISVLRSCLNYYHIAIPSFRSRCTFELFGTRLNDACACLGIELHHHNALSDAIACGKLYQYYLDNNGRLPEIHRVASPSFKNHERLCGDALMPDFDNCCKESPFYRKKVVITGLFNTYSRNELAHKVKSMGGDLNTTVSPKTDFIICGFESGPKKLEKFENLRASGSQIQKIQENDFSAFGL